MWTRFHGPELRPGNEWPVARAKTLATYRVFVPLYSRCYFASAHCGKEWSAFTCRMARYKERNEELVRFIGHQLAPGRN
jgi:hypothetical protein